MIIENKYEAMAPYVETAQNSAQRMNALVNFIRSAGRPVTTRELNEAVRGGENLAKYLLAYGVIGSEIRAEEFKDIKVSEYIRRADSIIFKSKTEIIFRPDYKKEVTLSDYTINESGFWIEIKGTRKVQVKRKYWFWKN